QGSPVAPAPLVAVTADECSRGTDPLPCTTMNVSDASAHRRSIKKFTDRPIAREDIEALLDAAVLAPNHHLTQPWRFYVLGPAARRGYGLALGDRKARKLTDPVQAAAVREKTGAEHEAFPALIAVAMTLHES